MTPKLDEARLHVEKRRREDERMIGSIDQSIEASKEASKKKELYVLREILDSSSLVRAKLLGEIVAAPEEFLAAQNFLFRPRGKIGLPDLEETLFPALLDLTLIELSESVDSIISALYKPQFPEVLDFNSLLYSVFAKKRQAAVPEFDDGEVLVVEPPPPKFSVEIIEHVQNWAAATLKRLGKLDISEFLELGGRELSSEIELKCLVMVLFRSFAPSESVLGACTARVTGKRFRTRFVEGSMLELFAEVENGSNSQHSI